MLDLRGCVYAPADPNWLTTGEIADALGTMLHLRNQGRPAMVLYKASRNVLLHNDSTNAKVGRVPLLLVLRQLIWSVKIQPSSKRCNLPADCGAGGICRVRARALSSSDPSRLLSSCFRRHTQVTQVAGGGADGVMLLRMHQCWTNSRK